MSVIYLKIYGKYILEGSIEIIACKSFVKRLATFSKPFCVIREMFVTFLDKSNFRRCCCEQRKRRHKVYKVYIDFIKYVIIGQNGKNAIKIITVLLSTVNMKRELT
jgi:hypothetical protein